MSKSSIPKSLLSAYVDGEVSAEERAAVLRAAKQSASVQQVLDDYRQISQGLKSLHAETPSPELWDAVRTQIEGAKQPGGVRRHSLLSRSRVRVLGGGMAVAAAGIMALVWVSSRADRGIKLAEDQAILEAESGPNVERIKPEKWLTRQIARTHQVPKPGEVVQYLDDVADETVVIPMTVVDVQNTAGQIRLLLQKHGIDGAVADQPSQEPNVAILVESDWERVSSVMSDLDAQGFAVASSTDESAVRRMAAEPSASPSLLKAEVASNGTPQTASTTPAPPAESEEMVHAQVQAFVSDDFARKLEGRQFRGGEPESDVQASRIAGRSEADRAGPPATEPSPFKPWQMQYASHGPARVVFLIKRSGHDP